MKKLIAILGAAGLTTTASSAVVSCIDIQSVVYQVTPKSVVEDQIQTIVGGTQLKGWKIEIKNAGEFDNIDYTQDFKADGKKISIYVHIKEGVVTFGADKSMQQYFFIPVNRTEAFVKTQNKPVVDEIHIWNN